MEEIGLQFQSSQERVIDAVRRYVTQGGMRLIEECPLRKGLALLRAKPAGDRPVAASAARNPSRPSWRVSNLADLFEAYFDYYFRTQRRRALVVGPTVGRWTGILYDEKAIDCRLLRWVADQVNCRAVGFCFIENEEYSYIELAGPRVVEAFSSFLSDGAGRNFWSEQDAEPPTEGPWIAEGFLKDRYQFIPGFYDLPFLRGEKAQFACYRYSALPQLYDEAGNYPLSSFRYFYFHYAAPQHAGDLP